jgi:hypothetical protein
MEPEEFQRMRGTAFDRGRSGPAGLNAAHVDALNDPAVRKQLENLGLQMPPKDKLTPDALDLLYWDSDSVSLPGQCTAGTRATPALKTRSRSPVRPPNAVNGSTSQR